MKYLDEDKDENEIHKCLISKIENEDIEVLAKKLGYSHEYQAQKILAKFKNSKTLFDFLDSSVFDFRYTAKDFLTKLFEIYNLDKRRLKDIFSNFSAYKKDIYKSKNCYIFVVTDFIRKGEPIFVLVTLESTRRINIESRHLIFKSQEQIKQYIANIVQKHYQISKGKLQTWGKIKHYIFNCQGEKTIFDIDGNIIKTDEVHE